MKLFEWHNSSFPGNKALIPGFVDYLSGVWQNRNRYLDSQEEISEEEKQEQKIQKQRFFDFTVDGTISARNYVGVVQYQGVRVEVYPKIFEYGEGENSQKWQTNLLYWLSYCRKVKFPFSLAEVSKQSFEDYLEMLIYVFSHYTEEIIAQQPFQAYERVEEETSFLRGTLSFEKYTNRNLITGKWQNFYCSYEPFVYDNKFNQIIKYVSRRLLSISQNFRNKEKLNAILYLLHDVSDLQCTAEDCDKVKLNPLFSDHKHILELCRMYLSNQVIDMNSDDSNNFCFLIPMEYVFEDFISGFISRHWPELKIKPQSTDYLAYDVGRPVFQIRNDIYIDEKLIIDTKYKIRSRIDNQKAGVSQADLYQMVSYSIRRNCKEVLLLYPHTSRGLNDPKVFEVPSKMYIRNINIHIQNIDITFEDIQAADDLIKARLARTSPVFRNL